MSRAAAALLRALLSRVPAQRNRILLTGVRSTDWQSLTFTGERHDMHFKIPAPDAAATARLLADGLGAAEFTIPGQFVADIVARTAAPDPDGSIELTVEALTIAE